MPERNMYPEAATGSHACTNGKNRSSIDSKPAISQSPSMSPPSRTSQTHAVASCLLQSPHRTTTPEYFSEQPLQIRTMPSSNHTLSVAQSSPLPPTHAQAQPTSPELHQTRPVSMEAIRPASTPQRPIVRRMGSEFGGDAFPQGPTHDRSPSEVQDLLASFTLDPTPSICDIRPLPSQPSSNPFDDENFFQHMSTLRVTDRFPTLPLDFHNSPMSPSAPLSHAISSSSTLPTTSSIPGYQQSPQHPSSHLLASHSCVYTFPNSHDPHSSILNQHYNSPTQMGPPMRRPTTSNPGATGTPKRSTIDMQGPSMASLLIPRNDAGASPPALHSPTWLYHPPLDGGTSSQPMSSSSTATLAAAPSGGSQPGSSKAADLTAPANRSHHRRTPSNNPFLGQLDFRGKDNPAVLTQQSAINSVTEDDWYSVRSLDNVLVSDGTLRFFGKFQAAPHPTRFCLAVLMLEVKNNTFLDLQPLLWHVTIHPNAAAAHICPPYSLSFKLGSKHRAVVPVEYRPMALDNDSQSTVFTVVLACDELKLSVQFDALWPLKLNIPL